VPVAKTTLLFTGLYLTIKEAPLGADRLGPGALAREVRGNVPRNIAEGKNGHAVS